MKNRIILYCAYVVFSLIIIWFYKKSMSTKEAQVPYLVRDIKAIIGLGNPGVRYAKTRHNIGFLVIDEFAQRYNASWQEKGEMATATISLFDHDPVQTILLVKPLTFMNSSGRVIPALAKKGIKPEEIVVIHDELEKKLGGVSIRSGGSARGHNGLRSLISTMGPNFWRLRFGIDRPEDKAQVSSYVLSSFSPAEQQELENLIDQAIDLLLT